MDHLKDLEYKTAIKSGGKRGIRTPERTKRADLQSASFSHLDILPKNLIQSVHLRNTTLYAKLKI